MARPRLVIDEDQVKKLAAIQCSNEEMASVLNCSKDTLERRYAAIIKDGRASGRMSLKRKQYEVAMSGNVGMLIWLGKQYLDQSEKMVQHIDANVKTEDKKDERINEVLTLLQSEFKK